MTYPRVRPASPARSPESTLRRRPRLHQPGAWRWRPLFRLLTPPSERPAWVRVWIVAVCLSIALAVRFFLADMLEYRAPFTMALPAILVSAWIGGTLAGIVCTVLATFLGGLLFLTPAGGLWISNLPDLLTAILFLVQGGILSLLCGLLHSVFGEWRRAQDQAAIDFENLANRAPGFVWSVHPDGSPRFVNQNWLRFTGLDGWGPTADRLAPVHPADLHRVRNAVAEAHAKREAYSIEYRLRRQDGQYRWIRENGIPQVADDGRLEGMIGSCADVTAVHQEREELLFTGELQSALSSTLDIEKTATGVARAIVPALADWCAVHLANEDGDHTPLLHSTKADGSIVAAPLSSASAGTFLTSAARRVLSSGAPLFASTIDETFLGAVLGEQPATNNKHEVPLNSYLGVPLRVHGRTIGVLSMATCGPNRTLGDDSLELAQRIAGIAAYALENARLYRRAQDALTAEAEARHARERSERQFRAAWEADVFATCVLDRRGRVTAANDAFLRLSGYTAEELAAGQIDLHSRLGNREAQFGQFTWEHLPENGPCEPFEKVCLRRDGRSVPVLVAGSIQPDLESCIIFLIDLTARKAAETALERQRALLKTIIDTVPAMVGYIDHNERLVHHNVAFEEWLGRGFPEINGRPLREVLPAAVVTPFEVQLRNALGGQNVRFELALAAPTRRRDLMVSLRPDFDADGSIVGVVVHAFDITESRRLGAAIARSEKRYRTLISASAAIVWAADSSGAIVEAEGWERFTGENQSAGSFRSWWERIHPDDRSRVETGWHLACRSGANWECVYRLLASAGRYHHVHARAAAITGESGEVVEWVGTVTDIHGQVEAEQSLRRKEAELELAVNTMPALVAYVSRDLRFGLVNRAHEQWFGRESAGIRGLPVRELLGETAFAAMYDKISRVLTGETVRYEAEVEFGQGPRRWITAQFTPHLGDDSRVLGYFSLILDISERKAAETQLADALERYRFLADAMPQNVWTTDAAGHLDYANQRWVDYTGCGIEQLRARAFGTAVHPDDAAQSQTQWETALADGRRFEIEHRLRDSGGRYHWFLSRALARRDAQGRIVQWVGTDTNIDAQRQAFAALAEARSELKRHAENLEQEIRHRTARLEEVNVELEAFTYSASHDLRVPIHHVHEFAQAIAGDSASSLSPRSRDDLRLIVTSTERMDRLIVDLLAYSRLSRAELNVVSTELEPIIESVLAGFQTTIARTQATIAVERPLPAVLADRVGLSQALSNLVANALKFAAPGRAPCITLRATNEHGAVRLCVEDNGIGIPAHQHQAIFRLFHRLNGTQKYPGTGIGLSLVAKAMTRMGGSCGVESEPGAGSRFWLQFQATEPAAAGSGNLPGKQA
ncbi:MAG: PAS domain S-box protein [Opitutaceae bacterium]